uniref:Uncharacterized protein n=1 Tax=Micrurus corallinus TaxID=54390 RepID=A0A2D4FFN7_MICCO
MGEPWKMFSWTTGLHCPRWVPLIHSSPLSLPVPQRAAAAVPASAWKMIHDGSPWMEGLATASPFYMSCSDPWQTAAYTHRLQILEAAVGYNPLGVPFLFIIFCIFKGVPLTKWRGLVVKLSSIEGGLKLCSTKLSSLMQN